ncbi:MAG: tRNA (adenosine(37)-N6)-threonylcarbamoyltransferase complex dimerization subunit type 1 TsaB [Chloroflexi bacterium]|nr:tRNA (adenosine(37)-N6)-threonylcarbamoyltransferase complex dimerization subunit type 1 TsaB [Chloroflexota bacterium]
MELAIDTSTEIAGITLSSEGKVIAELTWRAGQNHTAGLMPNLNHLLAQAKLSLKDINGIIVAKGPGSFNGLRVGMSAAKGFASALNIPLVGISTLEVEAFPYSSTGLPICPIFNAGRGEVAAALFQTRRGKWLRLTQEHITTIESLVNDIKARTIFCGEITRDMQLQLKAKLGRKASIVDSSAALRRSGYLAELGWSRLKAGDFDNTATLEPLYLRRPSITISSKGNLPLPE